MSSRASQRSNRNSAGKDRWRVKASTLPGQRLLLFGVCRTLPKHAGREIMMVAEIDTSDADWATKIAKAYRDRSDFTFRDSAKLGVDLAASLFSVLSKAGLNGAQISAVALALGVTGLGVRIVRAALLDPEPVSRIGLAVIGAVMTMFGSGSAIYVLTGLKPKSIKASASGFEVSFHS